MESPGAYEVLQRTKGSMFLKILRTFGVSGRGRNSGVDRLYRPGYSCHGSGVASFIFVSCSIK